MSGSQSSPGKYGTAKVKPMTLKRPGRCRQKSFNWAGQQHVLLGGIKCFTPPLDEQHAQPPCPLELSGLYYFSWRTFRFLVCCEMKAIRVASFGGPEVLQCVEVPSPQPAHGEVLIRVRAIGINPVDLYIRAGTYPAKPNLPYTPGTDAAGEVVAVGDGVHTVAVGDRVYTTGTVSGAYAELALCSFDQVWSLPKETSFAQGAALSVPYTTAYKALFIRAKAQRGETVLVHGATGGVGLAAVQFARSAGIHVLGTGGTPEGLKLLSAEGAEQVFDHHAPDYTDAIMAATDGRGVDIIIEMLANINLQQDLTLLAKYGRIVIVGSRGKTEIDPRALMRSEGQILATMSATKEERATAQAAIRIGLENKSLRPIISKEFPLSQAAAAHQAVLASKAPGKIILDPAKI